MFFVFYLWRLRLCQKEEEEEEEEEEDDERGDPFSSKNSSSLEDLSSPSDSSDGYDGDDQDDEEEEEEDDEPPAQRRRVRGGFCQEGNYYACVGEYGPVEGDTKGIDFEADSDVFKPRSSKEDLYYA